MALYEYRCAQHGLFEQNLPLGTAPQSITCACCGGQAQRMLSAPMFRSATRSAWTAAMDRADKSRYEPDVVSRLPPSGVQPRTITLTPKLRGLPRP